MKSNFMALKSQNNDLFQIVYSAENLYVNGQYEYIPTALRIFTEGIMQEVLGIDFREQVSLNEMIFKFSHKFDCLLTKGAAHKLRRKGNESTHFKPSSLNSGEIVKLFEEAFQLQYFYLEEHKKLKKLPSSFNKKSFPEPSLALDNELREQQRLSSDKQLFAVEINKLEEQNYYLQTQLDIYEENLKKADSSLAKTTMSLSSSSHEKETLQLKSQVEALKKQKQQYEIEKEFFARKINDTKLSQKKQSPKKKHLLEKIEVQIKTEDRDFIQSKNEVFNLDENQQELVDIDSGLHFLAAPPGSGKTMILTKRLERALELYDDDKEIICLTFTTKAAQEMRDRAKRDLAANVIEGRSPFIGNFHNFCLDLHRNNKDLSVKFRFATILNDEYRNEFFYSALEQVKKSAFTDALITPPCVYTELIADSFTQHSSITLPTTELSHYHFLSPKLYPYLSLLDLSTDRETIQFAKEQIKEKLHSAILACHVSVVGLQKEIDYIHSANLLWQILMNFKKIKSETYSIDYDDILCSGLINLTQKVIHRKFIQVDEAQDLNPIQWRIISKLKADKTHIFAVGDTEQSIYGFLGADNAIVKKEVHEFIKHSLVNNYRSNTEIVKVLNSYRKTHWNMSEIIACNQGPCRYSTMLLRYYSIAEEYQGIKQAIDSILKNNKEKIRDIGLLLPTNKRVDALCAFLDTSKTHYFRVSSSDLMQKPIIQDWFSLIRMHKGTANRIDWYNIVYRLAKTKINDNRINKKSAMQFVDKLYAQNISISDISEIGIDKFQYRLKTLVNAWENEGIVIFDTETTGLDFDKSKIVQLAAVKIQNGIVVDEFDKYINIGLTDQNTKLDQEFEASSNIHKISREKVNAGEQAGDVFNDFFDFIGNKPLIAHNMHFDNTMLRMGIVNLGDICLARRFQEATKTAQFDTLLLSRALLPNEESYKLESLLVSHNLVGVNSHNALDDVKATASLMQLLVGMIKEKLNAIDQIIDEEDYLSNPLQIKITEINNFFRSFYASGDKIELSDILEAWLEYAYQQRGWYEEESKEAIMHEVKHKLCSWLKDEGYEDHIQDLFNEISPRYQKLFTLKESDLIKKGKDRLVISTIHRSKGLEFETVILPEVTTGQYPGWRPKETPEDELEQHKEEQKRLFYVALSRPKNKLIVSYHLQNANGYNTNISEYLKPCLPVFAWHNC